MKRRCAWCNRLTIMRDGICLGCRVERPAVVGVEVKP
jgi:hypothetical protein